MRVISPTCTVQFVNLLFILTQITQYFFKILLFSFWIYQHISILNVIILDWSVRTKFLFKIMHIIEDVIFSWTDLLMRKNNLLRCWRWSFSLLMLLCISVNLPYSWSSSCYLEVVDELQKRICRTASPYLMHLLNTWLTIKM